MRLLSTINQSRITSKFAIIIALGIISSCIFSTAIAAYGQQPISQVVSFTKHEPKTTVVTGPEYKGTSPSSKSSRHFTPISHSPFLSGGASSTTSGTTNNISNDKVVIINFDDSFKSQFLYAKPILDKYGFKATFFEVCGWI